LTGCIRWIIVPSVRVLRVSVVMLGAAALTSSLLIPAGASPILVGELTHTPTWYAHLREASRSGPAFADGNVYVATIYGVAAFPEVCDGHCPKLWQSDLPGSTLNPYQVVAGSGYVGVFRSFSSGISIFDGSCATDGSVCQPLWSLSDGGGQMVGASLIAAVAGASGLSIYPLACSDPCSPTRILPHGGPWTVLHGVLYLEDAGVLYGYSLSCVTAPGGACPPVFRVGKLRDRATLPVATADRVIFATGHRPKHPQIAAYPANCGQDCSPVWTANASSELTGGLVLAGDVVLTTSVGRLEAFPVACRPVCRPAWSAAVVSHFHIAYADEDRVIGISRFYRRPSSIYAFPTNCASLCEPMWSHRYSLDTGRPFGSVGDGRHIFVALSNHVVTYNLETGKTPWRGALPNGQGWWLDVQPQSLVVYVNKPYHLTGGKVVGFLP
jgi:hypothetical protein